jgi:hypothetical protein
MKSKSPPSRTERGKDGAPGFVGDVEDRPFMAAFSVRRFALKGLRDDGLKPAIPMATANAVLSLPLRQAQGRL